MTSLNSSSTFPPSPPQQVPPQGSVLPSFGETAFTLDASQFRVSEEEPSPTFPSVWPTKPEDLLLFFEKLQKVSTSARISLLVQTWAATYARKSHLPPGENDYSMEDQQDLAIAYVESQGWKLYASYEDPDRTGRNSKRPGLRQLMVDIRAGFVQVLVIHRLDRLYRNLEGLLNFVRFLNKHHVRLISVTEQIDTSTPWGMLVFQVLGAIAELWARQTSERTRMAKQKRVEKGMHNGNPSYGLCRGNCATCTDPNGEGYCPAFGGPNLGDGAALIWHPVDQYGLRLIQGLYETMSNRKIAEYINETDFTLPNGEVVHFRTRGVPNLYPPGKFTADSIRKIIANPIYVGYVARYESAPLDMNYES